MFDLLNTTVYAEQAAADAAAVPAGSGIVAFMPFIVMIVLFYFMLIRPQKKQEKKTKQMLASLQVGDKIVTIGGIHGKITKLKDDVVYVETGFVGNPQERSTIKLDRNAIKTVETIHDEQA